LKIDHLGIAVKDLDKTLSFYEDKLGLEKTAVETVADQGAKIAFLKIGESKIELLEALDEDGPIARHIAKRGEGIHHLALGVDNIEEKVSDMKEQGVRFIGEEPTPGAENMKIIFIHPKSSDGVLMELCEPLGEED